MTSLGIEPMTLCFVAQCLNKLCYCMPRGGDTQRVIIRMNVSRGDLQLNTLSTSTHDLSLQLHSDGSKSLLQQFYFAFRALMHIHKVSPQKAKSYHLLMTR
jgi:hypothetical protein